MMLSLRPALSWCLLLLWIPLAPGWGQTPTAKAGDEFLVNTTTTAEQTWPAVAATADGGFVVVWRSAAVEVGDPFPQSIQGQRFAFDGEKVGAQFLVNAYSTGGQSQPAIAADAQGGFVVVWQSSASDNGDFDGQSIQGRRFSSDATPIGAQFLVNSYTTGNQTESAVAVAPDGAFVVVWQTTDADNGDSSLDSIQGQRFSSAGDPSGGQFLVNTFIDANQQEPAVAMDADGDFVVVWNSAFSDNGDSLFSVQAQRFSSSGDPQGTQFLVNTASNQVQRRGSVAAEPAGGFVVVFQDSTNTGDAFGGVQGQRFTSSGVRLGSQFRVNAYTPDSQTRPTVAMDPEGDFVVVWQSFGSGAGDTSDQSVHTQRFASDGERLGDEFQVNSYTTGHQFLASLAVGQTGDFVAVWVSEGSNNGDSDGNSIQAQRFRATADVGDLVFRDENLDGLQTPGEPGVESVPVHLFESDGDLVESTVTDGDGAFLFRPKIAPQGVADEFFVRYEAPADLMFTAANAGTDDSIDSDAEPTSGETDDFVVLSAGEDHTDLDAGLAGGIGNRVWVDLDGNGIQDGGEPGADGVLVQLFDGTNVFQGSTTTSASGFYGFPGLEAGTYFLAFTAPVGTTFTARDQGADDALDSDVSPASGTTTSFVFSPGEMRSEWDAGLVANLSQIGDRVWLDDGNGVQDGGESGVEGVTVNLYREPDPPRPTELATLVGSDVADSDGFYSFTVEPGTYYLELVCPAGAFTLQNQGADDALDSDVNPATGTTSPFVLALGAPDSTRDAGLLDGDADGVATCVDNCPSNPDPNQVDSDGDGSGDPCDLCAGDDAGGDADGDGLCAGSPYECDDGDSTNACAVVFDDGFESGDTTVWSTTVN